MNEVVQKCGRRAREDRRTALILAARRSFVERGFEGTSLDDVIAEVGGSRRNIYAQFGNKEGLLRAVMHQIIGELAETADVPPDRAASPREWLVAVGYDFTRMMLRPDVVAVFRQFIAVGGTDEAEFEELWRHGPERIRAVIARWLAARDREGALCVPDPDFAARLLPEMLRGSLQIELLLGRRAEIPDDEVRAHVEQSVDFFLGALKC